MDIDREQVKTLAIAIGIRNAAKRLGLSEVRVRQWSSRGKWFAKTPAKAIRTRPPVTVSHTPAEALEAQLREDSEQTRLGLSKATRSASKTFARMKGARVIHSAQELRHVTSAASTLHGWEEKRDAGSINLNVGIMLGGMEP